MPERFCLAKGVALMDARLRILSGPHAGELIAIQHGKLLIGREEDCQLRPESEFVSRHHCVLLLDEYTLRIRDLGSKNGTFVNGHRIGNSETILRQDDMISIGEMIGQINLSPVSGQIAAAETGALHGTGTFEGDTVQADVPAVPDPPSGQALPTPLMPDPLPAASDQTETKTVFERPEQGT